MMKKFFLVVVIIVILVVAIPVVSLILLNSDWLKDKLVEQANANLDAELAIDSISFLPFQGKASLEGGSFSRKDETSELDVKLDSVALEVSLRPLLYRSVQIRRFELAGPQITSVIRQLPDSKKGRQPEQTEPEEKAPEEQKVELNIAEFLIRDGAIDVTVMREGFEPVTFKMTDINYTARNVSPDSLRNLFYGADIHCDVEAGGKESTLDKKASSTPSTFSLTGVDLSYVTKLLDQSERVLSVSDGLMNVGYTLGEEQVQIKVDLKGMKLAENPDAAEQKFMFIPTDRIIKYVEKNDGNMTLEFELSEEVKTSDDLGFIVSEFRKGLQTAILEKLKSEGLDTLLEEGKEKVLEEGKKRLLEEEKKKVFDFLKDKKKDQ
jgi:hypothetical protein